MSDFTPTKVCATDLCTVQTTLDGFAVVDARGHTLAVRDNARAAAFAAQALNGGRVEHAAIHVPQRPQRPQEPERPIFDLFDDPELLSLHSES